MLEKYDLKLNLENYNNYKKCYQDTLKQIKQKYQQIIEKEWSANLSYAKNVIKEDKNITFPAHQSPSMESWRLSVLNSAAEEQLHGLGANPQRPKCIKGCNADENAYHVASACPTRAFASRHDFVVHWTLKCILKSLGAPEESIKNLQFGKASIYCQFEVGRRNITIDAGNKILTEKRLYHNRPDITVKMTNPTQIFIFEIAISHIQNYREQEKLKHIRYAVNSVTKLTNSKITNIPRDLNLVSELEQIYRCPVHLAANQWGHRATLTDKQCYK